MPILGGGMSQLIVFRAIQGIGGGALFTTAFAIIADLFGPRERGEFSGLFGATFGVASVHRSGDRRLFHRSRHGAAVRPC